MTRESQTQRLELLIGHLSDLLGPTRDLVKALQLQATASATTRAKLDRLNDLTGSVWHRLGVIADEAKSLR